MYKMVGHNCQYPLLAHLLLINQVPTYELPPSTCWCSLNPLRCLLCCDCPWSYVDRHQRKYNSSTWRRVLKGFCANQLSCNAIISIFVHRLGRSTIGLAKTSRSTVRYLKLYRAIRYVYIYISTAHDIKGQTQQSSDLVTWTRQNDALSPISGTMISTSNIVERPKG
jgi:ribosomal protein L30/L7E